MDAIHEASLLGAALFDHPLSFILNIIHVLSCLLFCISSWSMCWTSSISSQEHSLGTHQVLPARIASGIAPCILLILELSSLM